MYVIQRNARKYLVDYDAKITIAYKTIKAIEKKNRQQKKNKQKKKEKTMIVLGNTVRASRIGLIKKDVTM